MMPAKFEEPSDDIEMKKQEYNSLIAQVSNELQEIQQIKMVILQQQSMGFVEEADAEAEPPV